MDQEKLELLHQEDWLGAHQQIRNWHTGYNQIQGDVRRVYCQIL